MKKLFFIELTLWPSEKCTEFNFGGMLPSIHASVASALPGVGASFMSPGLPGAAFYIGEALCMFPRGGFFFHFSFSSAPWFPQAPLFPQHDLFWPLACLLKNIPIILNLNFKSYCFINNKLNLFSQNIEKTYLYEYTIKIVLVVNRRSNGLHTKKINIFQWNVIEQNRWERGTWTCKIGNIQLRSISTNQSKHLKWAGINSCGRLRKQWIETVHV